MLVDRVCRKPTPGKMAGRPGVPRHGHCPGLEKARARPNPIRQASTRFRRLVRHQRNSPPPVAPDKEGRGSLPLARPKRPDSNADTRLTTCRAPSPEEVHRPRPSSTHRQKNAGNAHDRQRHWCASVRPQVRLSAPHRRRRQSGRNRPPTARSDSRPGSGIGANRWPLTSAGNAR